MPQDIGSLHLAAALMARGVIRRNTGPAQRPLARNRWRTCGRQDASGAQNRSHKAARRLRCMEIRSCAPTRNPLEKAFDASTRDVRPLSDSATFAGSSLMPPARIELAHAV